MGLNQSAADILLQSDGAVKLDYGYSDIADDANNLSDSVRVVLGINQTPSDQLSLTDALADQLDVPGQSPALSFEDSLSFSDALETFMPLGVVVGDDANNLADDATNDALDLFEQIHADDLNNLSDAVLRQLDTFLEIDDNINNLLDEVRVSLGYLLTNSDNINNLADVLVLSAVIELTKSVGDTINNWSDATAVELIARGTDVNKASLESYIRNWINDPLV